MNRDAAGTSGEAGLTSGGAQVPSGFSPRYRRMAMVGVVVFFAALQGSVNGVSRLSDLRGAGSDVASWAVAVDESTSFVAWLVCMVVIWRVVAYIRPPRFGSAIALLLHLGATVPVSLLHIGLMVLFREGACALGGAEYDFAHDGLWSELLYEYRKDAPAYFLLAGAFAVIMWLTRPGSAAAEGEAVLTVQDGSARHRIPVGDIAWAEAAGNYVAIHWHGRQALHRVTLASLADRLGPAFVRIHRSRLVRRSAIRTTETLPSGDFTVTLEDGTHLRGSRRFRGALS